MAKPVTEEELQLKKRARRRLVGAIALVAGVAAVLPMVLDSEPKATSREINIQIPSPDGKVEAKDVAKAGVTPPGKDVAKAKPTPDEKKDAPGVPAEEKTSEPVVAKVAEKAPEKAVEKKAPEKKAAETVVEKPVEKATEKPAPKSTGKFYVQVVAVADTEKAKQVRDQIQGANVRAYTEDVTTATGKVTRVRAGPFATREEAERARAQLSLAGLEGKVGGN